MADEFQYDVFLSHSAKDKAVERSRVLSLAHRMGEGARRAGEGRATDAFGSDWAQLESGTFRFRDPLNQERRFIPMRLDDAPIKGSLAQFLYGNGWTERGRSVSTTVNSV